ncbi:MAG: VWA domain-containing protein, partial [Ilumatobacteraceae bacterium]|nr:VWA domain-containing protein [Ilumatobacteraceae bacterium]
MSWLEFISPWRLVLLVVPVLLGVGYLVLQARRRRYALRFTSVELLDEVAPDRPGWRRHVTAVVLLLGIVVGALATARPTVADEVTETRRIVVLAIDTSLSMEATDVDPSRIEAAKDAAGRFLDVVPDGVAVGVVGFDGQARQLIQPTTRLDAVRRVIDRAELGQGTAIGDAVIASVGAIETARDDEVAAGSEEAPGSIVLLSDGETTQGTPNEEGAALARERGIPVNTIAFGTDAGSIVDPTTGDSVPVPVNR